MYSYDSKSKTKLKTTFYLLGVTVTCWCSRSGTTWLPGYRRLTCPSPQVGSLLPFFEAGLLLRQVKSPSIFKTGHPFPSVAVSILFLKPRKSFAWSLQFPGFFWKPDTVPVRLAVSRPFLKLDTRSRQVYSFPPLFKTAETVHMKFAVSRLFYKLETVPVRLAVPAFLKNWIFFPEVGVFLFFF